MCILIWKIELITFWMFRGCSFNIKYIKSTLFENQKRYWSEEDGKRVALEDSATLDGELKRAFMLETYIKICIKKMEKRIKKVHRFSKYNLN